MGEGPTEETISIWYKLGMARAKDKCQFYQNMKLEYEKIYRFYFSGLCDGNSFVLSRDFSHHMRFKHSPDKSRSIISFHLFNLFEESRHLEEIAKRVKNFFSNKKANFTAEQLEKSLVYETIIGELR